MEVLPLRLGPNAHHRGADTQHIGNDDESMARVTR